MAARDIMPFEAFTGGHVDTYQYPISGSSSFVVGEVVNLDANGQLVEPADNPAAADVLGVALGPGGLGNTRGNNWKKAKGATQWEANDLVPVVHARPGQRFVTKNFTTNGTAFGNAAPAAANIGDNVGLALISGAWGLDTTATNTLCRVIDVLDSLKRSVVESGDTGVYVVFEVVQSELTETAAP